MNQRAHNSPNIVLLRGAALWLLIALVLAWCMVGLNFDVHFLKAIFLGKQTRLVQAHIDFLLMTALILGFLRGTDSAPLVGSLGDGSWRLWKFQHISAGVHFSRIGICRPGGWLIPHDLPILCDGKRFNDDLWIWGGGNHRLVVVIPACTQR
jgi:hypothetical protein